MSSRHSRVALNGGATTGCPYGERRESEMPSLREKCEQLTRSKLKHPLGLLVEGSENHRGLVRRERQAFKLLLVQIELEERLSRFRVGDEDVEVVSTQRAQHRCRLGATTCGANDGRNIGQVTELDRD